MVELADVLVGFLIGGLLTSVLTYLLQEKIRTRKRKKEVANLIIGEINQHMSALKIIHDSVMPVMRSADKRTFLGFAPTAFFYSDKVLTAVLSEMMEVFPLELYFEILFYYKHAEVLNMQLQKAIDREDKNVFEALFSGARRPTLDHGFRIVIRILEETLKDVEKADVARGNAKLFGLEKQDITGKGKPSTRKG